MPPLPAIGPAVRAVLAVPTVAFFDGVAGPAFEFRNFSNPYFAGAMLACPING